MARYDSVAETEKSGSDKQDKDSQSPKSSSPERRSDSQHSKEQNKKGKVAGGKYLEESSEDGPGDQEERPLKKVDFDMPLTLTERKGHDGGEVIVLDFAEGDKENPFNWSEKRKRFIAILLNLMTLFIGLATTAYSSGIGSMAKDLHTTKLIGQLGLFTFNFACALAPLFLAPFCELVGRKTIYTGAYGCFTLCFIGLALGKNIATVLVMRTLLGLFGCVGTILVGGTFSDMYDSNDRAKPMAAFSYVAILGTVFAPVYAGFINQTLGWRWIEGIQGLSNIPLLIVVIVLFRETRGGVTLQKRAKKLREATGDERYKSPMDLQTENLKDMLHASSVKAMHMLITEPVVFAFGLWIAFSWFLVFLFLSVVPITFREKRGWNEGVSGLPYISLAIGVTIGWAANRFQMRKYDKIVADDNRKVVPENRLYGAMFGAVWLPIGLFLYSFTQYAYLPWIAPTISLAPIAVGIFFVFEATYSYTSDCYGQSASSAIAGQGLMRNTLGGVAPLFATPFFHNLGSQYAGLLLAIIATALSFIPFVFFKYGSKLRERSKLAQKF